MKARRLLFNYPLCDWDLSELGLSKLGFWGINGVMGNDFNPINLINFINHGSDKATSQS